MNTALVNLMNTLSTATTNAETARNRYKEVSTPNRRESKGYNEGKASGLNEAYYIMKAELERLQNKFQNGSLTQEDFYTH